MPVIHLLVLLPFLLRWAVPAGPQFSPDRTAPSTAFPESLTVAQWRADLRYFADELSVRHANAFHTIAREQFERAVARLDSALPHIPEHRRLLELARLGALVGDGHTGVFLFSNRLFPQRAVRSLRRLPVEFARAGDTVIVVAAGAGLEWTNGQAVTHVEGWTAREALDSVRPLVSADNEHGAARIALTYLAIPEVLHGLGIAPTADSIRLRLSGPAGDRRDVVLGAVAWEQTRNLISHTPTAASRLVYGNRQTRYWARALPEEHAVYAQINSWDIGPGEPDRAFASFTDSLRGLLSAPAQPRLVLDFRWNSGGRIDAARHLLAAILALPHLRQEGKLFAITGPNTFSAGVLFLTDLERYTNVLLVGDPTAGRVNAYGELRRFVLPHSGVEVRYSALHMVRADPWDRRPAVYPDLPAPFTADAYRAGADPPLSAIARYAGRRHAAGRLLAEYRQGGVPAAIRVHQRLRHDSATVYVFSEATLDQLADTLLGEAKHDDALRLLELNASQYPHDGWVIYRLAEGYRVAGNRAAALTRYREAFALDKRLAAARDRILELERAPANPSRQDIP